MVEIETDLGQASGVGDDMPRAADRLARAREVRDIHDGGEVRRR